MRILKRKILLSNKSENPELPIITKDKNESMTTPASVIKKPINKSQNKRKRRKRIGGSGYPSEKTKATKHVVKNFGKAIASFAVSDLAEPYLKPFLEEEGINLEDFVEYIDSKKDSIEGIESLRSLLVAEESDTPLISPCKRVFQKIAEIFIKYFSVNWIYSGKLKYRKVHLKYRFKMLRRIKNPSLFTYLMSGKI